jgi:protein-tyrosine phosphatase
MNRGLRRAAAHEVLAGRLYQRGQTLTWPADQKRRLLSETGATVVVNLWNKVDPDLTGVININWPIAGNVVPPDADAMVRSLSLLMGAGHVLLVQCEAGVNRSVWLCGRLVATRLGVSGQAALDVMRATVPGLRLRPALQLDLETR